MSIFIGSHLLTHTISSNTQSHLPASIQLGSSSVSALHDLAPLRHDIATCLNIASHLLPRKSVSLRLGYQKFLAIAAAKKRIEEMINQGTWTLEKPTEIDVIEIFVAKTVFYRSYADFGCLDHHSRLLKWLEGGEDAPSNFSIWRDAQRTPNFADLAKYLAEPEKASVLHSQSSQQVKRKARQYSDITSPSGAGPSKKAKKKDKDG